MRRRSRLAGGEVWVWGIGVALMLGLVLLFSRARTVDARSCGAVGDGFTVNTLAIQRAIDDCARVGGGRVTFADGDYVTGTLRLRDGVNLHVDRNARILGSTNLGDYPPDLRGAVEAPAFSSALFYAEGARGISFTGNGQIDGRGCPRAFPVLRGKKLGSRPMLMRLVDCRDITVTGLTFRNPASWGLHLVNCESVRFRAIRMESQANNINNDGIDLDGCRDVQLDGCVIQSGDDAVCLKSTGAHPCENIEVRSCELSSHTAGFKLGTSSRGGFVNIRLQDSLLRDCPMGAIKLLLVDGGRMENVVLTDLRMERVGSPLFIRLGNRGRAYDRPTEQVYAKNRAPEGRPVGSLRGIQMRRVQAEVSGSQRDREPIMITGIPGHFLQDLTLEDVEISFPGGGTTEEAARNVPEDEARYPEQYFFGVLPASCLFARHVHGLTIRNVRFKVRQPDSRPPVVLQNVDGWKADDLRVNGVPWLASPTAQETGPDRDSSQGRGGISQ